MAADTSLRFSYVRKDVSGDSGIWNAPQQGALLAGRGISCAVDPAWDCPLNALTGAVPNVQRVPDDVARLVDNRIAAFPDMEAAYDTLQVPVNRRFTGGLLLQASFDYQWRDEFRAAGGENRSPLFADPLVVGSGGHGRIWQNHSLDVDGRQATTNWGARLLARYTLPYDVGLSANVRHQSGWPYALIPRVDIPGTGTNQPIFLTDLAANRSENVTLADLRLDKAFAAGASGRLTLMQVLEELGEHRVGEPARAHRGEDERPAVAERSGGVENPRGAVGQRDPVLALGLHVRCRPSAGPSPSHGLSFRRSMATAHSSTDRMRWRTALAVSALTCQIGLRISSTSAVLTSETGWEPMRGKTSKRAADARFHPAHERHASPRP